MNKVKTTKQTKPNSITSSVKENNVQIYDTKIKELETQVKTLLKAKEFTSDLQQLVAPKSTPDLQQLTINPQLQLLIRYVDLQIFDRASYLRIKSLCCELYDHYGMYNEAQQLINKDDTKIIKELHKNSFQSLANKLGSYRLVREHIRLVLNIAHINYYRKHEYQKAEKIMGVCLKLLKESNEEIKEEFNFYGVTALCYYYIGRLYRQTHQYAESENCFAEAINFYCKRAEAKIKRFTKIYESTDKEKKQHTLQKNHSYKAHNQPPLYNSNTSLNFAPPQTPSDHKTSTPSFVGVQNDSYLLHHYKILQEELIFSRYKTAVCLSLGLSWVQYTRGSLTEALNSIRPARLILLEKSDKINKGYTELIYGSILRSLAGYKDKKQLEDAKGFIEQAVKLFDDTNHEIYKTRALYELSLVNLNLGNCEEAKTIAEQIQYTKDTRWKCNILILLSRIKRTMKAYSEAESLASHIESLAKEKKQVLPRIHALISRAKIKFDKTLSENPLATKTKIGDLKKVKEDLELALDINKPSQDLKTEAICRLNLCEYYIEIENSAEAESQLSKWETIKNQLENKKLHEKAAALRQKLYRIQKEFTLKENDLTTLDYKEFDKKLRYFLIVKAQEKTQYEKKAMAKALGISRQTLDMWFKDFPSIHPSKKLK